MALIRAAWEDRPIRPHLNSLDASARSVVVSAARNSKPVVNKVVLDYRYRHHLVGTWWLRQTICLLVGCLTSQQQASVSQGPICSDNFTCCHTEIDVADQTFYLTQSQYTDTGPTSPSADPITPGAWQGSHWSANF